VEERGHDIIWDTIPEFAWADWWKPRTTWIRIAGFWVKLRTGDFTNTKKESLTTQPLCSMSATCFRSRTQLWTRSYKGMILSACGTTQRRSDTDWVQHFHTMVTKWEHEKAKWKRASHVDCHGTTHAYRQQRHTRGLGPLWQYDHVENTMFKSNRSLPRAKVEWWALTPVPCNPWTESQKRDWQSMWDVRWTKWHWDRFLSEFFSFTLSISFHHSNILPRDGRSSETKPHPNDTNNS
jgi:hypothetical protein